MNLLFSFLLSGLVGISLDFIVLSFASPSPPFCDFFIYGMRNVNNSMGHRQSFDQTRSGDFLVEITSTDTELPFLCVPSSEMILLLC
jgi:hypothetical protein